MALAKDYRAIQKKALRKHESTKAIALAYFRR